MAESDQEISQGQQTQERIHRDGVSYARFQQAGEVWRLGAVTSRWEQLLPGCADPSVLEQEVLREQGIYLAKERNVEGLAVMCCGQGAIWPHMGRELYEYFPAARAAMDRLAACANWDVLALLDEPNVETIGLTRWQQPYLFLLEYAQWSLYCSLGLRPRILCGHSLGQLIALCLAGIYSPEICWYILDTRSQHMADLEAKSRRDTSMMAVYANYEQIEAARALWPELYISNYNTPGQSILSGPRDILLEARKYFRKHKMPAVMLNVTLAFHHPSMRVLRDLSYRRLYALDIQSPKIDLLSCVTADLYPRTKAEICTAIVDLDENAVRWVQCVDALWNRFQVRHFLELGPQDTLSGLVRENQPQAHCLSSAMRGHEREHIRRTLAELYALGYLDHTTIWQGADLSESEAESVVVQEDKQEDESCDAQHAEMAERIHLLRELLGKACGRKAEEIRARHDLRFDLALRSSQFPSLLEEASTRLGVQADFEDLLQVSTVADLERVLLGRKYVQEDEAKPLGLYVERPSLVRADLKADHWHEETLLPWRKECLLQGGGELLFWGQKDELALALLSSLLPLRPMLTLPQGLTKTTTAAKAAGASVNIVYSANVLEFLQEQVDCTQPVLVLELCPHEIAATKIDDFIAALERLQCQRLLVIELERQDLSVAKAFIKQIRAAGFKASLAMLDSNYQATNAAELGDLVGTELVCANLATVHWLLGKRVYCLGQNILDQADSSPLTFPERTPFVSRQTPAQCFQAQYALEYQQLLVDMPQHEGWHDLPVSLFLLAELFAAKMMLPWLLPVGFVDVHCYQDVQVRAGIVRETRIISDRMPWLMHDDVLVRMVKAKHAVRDLTPSLRHEQSYSLVCTSQTMMAAFLPCLEPLWEVSTAQKQPLDLTTWYRKEGYGQRVQLLQSAFLGSQQLCVARLDGQSLIALARYIQYNAMNLPTDAYAQDHDHLALASVQYLLAVEAVLQAIRVSLAFDPPKTPCALLPTMIGFIHYGQGDFAGDLSLSVRRCWDQSYVVRYEAQVLDAQGRCLLAMHHIEFEQRDQGYA